MAWTLHKKQHFYFIFFLLVLFILFYFFLLSTLPSFFPNLLLLQPGLRGDKSSGTRVFVCVFVWMNWWCVFLSLDVNFKMGFWVILRNQEQRVAVSGGEVGGGGERSPRSAPSSSHCEVIWVMVVDAFLWRLWGINSTGGLQRRQPQRCGLHHYPPLHQRLYSWSTYICHSKSHHLHPSCSTGFNTYSPSEAGVSQTEEV